MIRTLFVSLAVIAIPPAAAVAQKAPAPAKEKRICRSAASIGSLVQQRTCHTASEWKDIDSANDRAMQQMRQETVPGSNPGPS